MNPSYGIIMWIVVGALAGWIGSKIINTDSRQGSVANVLFGIVGAVLGGALTRSVLGARPTNNEFIVTFGVALLGACVAIAIGKAITGRRRV